MRSRGERKERIKIMGRDIEGEWGGRKVGDIGKGIEQRNINVK